MVVKDSEEVRRVHGRYAGVDEGYVDRRLLQRLLANLINTTILELTISAHIAYCPLFTVSHLIKGLHASDSTSSR